MDLSYIQRQNLLRQQQLQKGFVQSETDEDLAKSLEDNDYVPYNELAKSIHSNGRMGLTLKQVTDSKGRMTHRWVNPNGDEHAPHGSRASFEHEGKTVHGTIGRVSKSSSRYVIKGDDGAEYKKHAHEITPHTHTGAGAPADDKKADAVKESDKPVKIRLNLKGEEVKLTDHEKTIADWVDSNLDNGTDQIFTVDVEHATGLSNKEARGAISSLVKKNMIDVNKSDGLISRFWTAKDADKGDDKSDTALTPLAKKVSMLKTGALVRFKEPVKNHKANESAHGGYVSKHDEKNQTTTFFVAFRKTGSTKVVKWSDMDNVVESVKDNKTRALGSVKPAWLGLLPDDDEDDTAAAKPSAKAVQAPQGKKIGKTKSGKPVFEGKNADDAAYKDFDHKDHSDAATLHSNLSGQNAQWRQMYGNKSHQEHHDSSTSHLLAATAKYKRP